MATLLKNIPTNDELVAIIEAIKNIESLLTQGLLRESELNDLENRASNAYESAVDHNSIQYRKYDRSRRQTTRWREVSRSGYVDQNDGAGLLELKQQIIELLDLHDIEVQPAEVFLPPNSEYRGRFILRNILSTAAKSIDIKDDYLFSVSKTTQNIELLPILQPYLGTSLSLSVRLLGSSKQLPAPILSDIKTFLKEHSSVKIMGYSHSSTGNRETHDRFIIIDEKDIYKIGTSIKDLGATQSNIDKVNDQSIKASYIKLFSEWWAKSSGYDGII